MQEFLITGIQFCASKVTVNQPERSQFQLVLVVAGCLFSGTYTETKNKPLVYFTL